MARYKSPQSPLFQRGVQVALVLVIVLGKLKTDYEYAYEQKVIFCKNAVTAA